MLEEQRKIRESLRALSVDERKRIVEDLKTDHGGFTKQALASIGILWPPVKGWRKRFVEGSVGPNGGQIQAKTSKHERRAKRQERKKKKKKLNARRQDDFLLSYEWRRLRYEVLKKYDRRCMCCGRTPDDGIKIHVDHVKPRRFYPELALCADNLQILCHECNHGKGNWDQTDWR